MAESVLIVDKSEGIATLTMNRPKAMNSLSSGLADALAQAFQELVDDTDIRVAILTGAGRAFCGGLDLKELAGMRESLPTAKMGASVSRFFRQMVGFDRPIIGAVNGPAVTGGFELALSCDILVASTKASFADTHARVGFIPGGGLSQILPRIIGPGRAKELSFTGNFLPAEKAEAWGLVNRVVAPEELLPVCRELAGNMLPCDQYVVREYKRLINQGFNTTLSEGRKLELDAYLEYVETSTSNFDDSRRSVVTKRGQDQQDRSAR
ncbi:MAG: enoyl-CoA hydratase [Proteobacteria bacterium]|nr:enoyl-CoA hydratase [Pseudomonadota bacterium]